MRIILLSSIFLLLMGCGNPLTRLIPKVEKLEPPAELMVPPKDLKIINKPKESDSSTAKSKQLDEFINETLNAPSAGK